MVWLSPIQYPPAVVVDVNCEVGNLLTIYIHCQCSVWPLCREVQSEGVEVCVPSLTYNLYFPFKQL